MYVLPAVDGDIGAIARRGYLAEDGQRLAEVRDPADGKGDEHPSCAGVKMRFGA